MFVGINLLVVRAVVVAKQQMVEPRIHIVVAVALHGIVMIGFHPCRRAPGRHPETHVGTIFLRSAYIGDDGELVALDVEVPEVEIAIDIAARIPVECIVVGIH